MTHKGAFANRNKTYINITTIYIKSMVWVTYICIPDHAPKHFSWGAQASKDTRGNMGHKKTQETQGT